jgi:hypothetical protein
MRPYPTDFDDKAILARQLLYRCLCEIIWDPARLGFTILAPRRISGPTHRSRARYGVDIPRLMSAGCLSRTTIEQRKLSGQGDRSGVRKLRVSPRIPLL